MTTFKTLVLALGLAGGLAACGGTGSQNNPQMIDQWVDSLIRDLADPSPARRLHAARALGIAGPKASRAIPALECALDDTDCNVRCAAHNALIGMGAEPRSLASAARLEQVRHD